MRERYRSHCFLQKEAGLTPMSYDKFEQAWKKTDREVDIFANHYKEKQQSKRKAV